MVKETIVEPADALILIDIQKDFFEGGFYPVKGADLILEPLLSVMTLFPLVVATQDLHYIEQFTHQKEGVFETGHCIERTPGADLHPLLANQHLDLTIRRDPKKGGESFSVFERSELATWLLRKRCRRIFVMGFTTEYGVKETVLDGLKRGFKVYVIEEGVKPRATAAEGAQALDEMKQAGAHIVSQEELVPEKNRASVGG
ncbi:MAG: isochorismatase family protein [Deltaproteobacteria bacterium]|nr:isochorismatase family protein [Deltaproteobacteria bacterium]